MMKRGYTRAQFLAKIRRVRAARPDLSLSSDFIIGFPTESDDDFMPTLDLIAEARFDCAYSFVYSPRPGTPAANLRDTVDIAIKEQRLSILQNRIRQLDAEFRQGLVCTTQSLLVARPSRRAAI